MSHFFSRRPSVLAAIAVNMGCLLFYSNSTSKTFLAQTDLVFPLNLTEKIFLSFFYSLFRRNPWWATWLIFNTQNVFRNYLLYRSETPGKLSVSDMTYPFFCLRASFIARFNIVWHISSYRQFCSSNLKHLWLLCLKWRSLSQSVLRP